MEQTRGMRIYLPATVSDLDAPHLSARTAFAVTEGVRDLAPSEDEEGWEYLAFLAAADAAIDEGEVTRIVIAADAPASETKGTGVVEVDEVDWADVVSIHIDDLSDAMLLADINSAQAEDGAARDRVNAADLLWYDVAERAEVVRLIAAI